MLGSIDASVTQAQALLTRGNGGRVYVKGPLSLRLRLEDCVHNHGGFRDG